MIKFTKKLSMLATATMAMGAQSIEAANSVRSITRYGDTRKTPLSKRQKRNRAKSRAARKARKISRPIYTP
jgi:hypothetical protein